MSERRLHCVPVAVAVMLLLPVPGAFAAPDLSQGRLLAGACAACHGTDGRSPGSIPAIHGRPAETIGELLLKYRSGDLKGTVMNRIAAGFTPEQIDAIARYYGGVK